MLTYFLLAAILAVCAGGFFSLRRSQTEGTDPNAMKKYIEEAAQLKSQLSQKSEELGNVRRELEAEKNERSQLQGKSKQLFAEHTKLEAKSETLSAERDELKSKLTRLEAEAKRRDGEFEDRVTKLATAEMSLKEERQRVIKEDDERRIQESEERDRMWAEHEMSVIATLTDLCKQPQFSFTSFSNTNLPDGFDGSLKPDFMIEFLNQYVIFDAKVSKAESLQTYINNAVKSTATKVKKNRNIFHQIFLVVPTDAISELKKTIYPQDEYTFYVVSPEALGPILAALKRITTYEIADEQFDPQQRENFISLLADLDYHINWRNSMDFMMMTHGIDSIQKIQKLAPALVDQVNQKMLEKKPPIPTSSDLKKLLSSTDVQKQEMEKLVSPKAAISAKDVEKAKELAAAKLF